MKIVSVALHPLLMVTYSCILLYIFIPEIYSPIPYEAIPYFIGSVSVTTVVVPLISLLFIYLSKRFSSMAMSMKESRSFPFFSIAAFYAITTYLFNTRMSLPKPIFMIMASVTLLIFIIFIFSAKYRINIHSTGMWAMAGIFTSLAFKYLSSSLVVPLSIIFMLAGLTTTSQLYLGKYTPMESWSGAILGFIVCFTGILLFG